MSLRSRLLVAVGAVAFVALVVADFATYSALRSFLLGRVDASLQQTHVPVERTAGRLAGADVGGPAGRPQGPPVAQDHGDDGFGAFGSAAADTFVEVRTPGGQVVGTTQPYYRPGGAGPYSPALPVTITGFRDDLDPQEPTTYFNAPAAQADGPTFRVRASVLGDGNILVLAAPLSDTAGTLRHLLWTELAVTGAALLVAGAVGLWTVRVGLRPLRAVEETAERIADGRLDERVPVDRPRTEVGRLATTFNVMLGRIQAAFAQRDSTEAALRRNEEQLRRFVADASHELRTPLAAVSAYAELFDRGASGRPADLPRVIAGIRGETARMSTLVEDLLLLARLDEGVPLDLRPVELVGLGAEAVEAANLVGPSWPVRLVAAEPVEVVADPVRCRQVLDNLLANVRAHTPPGTSTEVRVRSEDGTAVLEVADDGPGLSDEEAGRVFERFYRADPSRSRQSGGAGLGLSIVAAITAAHGGTVSVAGRPGGGAVFSVRLPAARPVTPTGS
ncbi:MAG TPA: HAMP domain-containing sensor histidine kinase [Acidimicrobiales bacterium]|nr:HAMP domain-containing sensor histidine kinase [Acidimicrobiales bacterium]